MASAVAKNLTEVQQAYEQRMGQAIKDVEHQVALIQAEKQKDKEVAHRTINELALARRELEAIGKELANLNGHT